MSYVNMYLKTNSKEEEPREIQGVGLPFFLHLSSIKYTTLTN
jgi:hypothetical protein